MYTYSGSLRNDLEIARAIASDFRKIGLNADTQSVERSVLTQQIRGKRINDLWLNGLASRSFGPDDLHSFNMTSVWDASRWLETSPRAEEFNKLNDEAQLSLDAKKQQELTWKATELFMDEAPWILLHREIFLYGINKRIDWLPNGYSRLHPWLPGDQDVRLTK